MKYVFRAMLCALVLPGCATVGASRAVAISTTIVEQALTQSPSELQSAADQGNADAQFSYSIVLDYGLNSMRPDADAANAYRHLALRNRGTTNTAIYVPTGRHGGHTQLVSVPQYDISAATAKAVDACVDALQARLKPETVLTQCGGPNGYAPLAALWSKSKL